MNTLRKNYLGYKKMFQTISSIFKEISKIMNWKKAKYQDTCPTVVRLSPGNFTWFLGSPFLVPYPSASSTYFGLWSLSPQPRRTTVSAWILNSYVTLRKLHTGMELGESWSHFMYFFFLLWIAVLHCLFFKACTVFSFWGGTHSMAIYRGELGWHHLLCHNQKQKQSLIWIHKLNSSSNTSKLLLLLYFLDTANNIVYKHIRICTSTKQHVRYKGWNGSQFLLLAVNDRTLKLCAGL